MLRKGLLPDKQELIRTLEKETGLKAVYCGPPTFRYIIGDHFVLRDGTLETDDATLMERLAEAGLIEGTGKKERISFSIKGFSGRNMTNLVNCFAAREKQLNKIVDHPNAFHMSVKLVRNLKKENPGTMADFMNVVYKSGGEKTMRGLKITGDSISFPGFPDTPTYRVLALKIVERTATQMWVKAEPKESDNEKYAFRNFLNGIGMGGPEYKKERKELLSRLEGDCAYSTEEKRLAFLERKRKNAEPDFIAL